MRKILNNLPTGFLNPDNKNHIQYFDERCGVLFPWYSKPFLDFLTTLDTSNWDVFEYGSGFSTLWYAVNCKSVISVEDDGNWASGVSGYLTQIEITNAEVMHERGGPDLFNSGEGSPYVLSIYKTDKLYDVVVIDGVHRNTCVKHAVKKLKPGGMLIFDNFNQASIGGSCKSVLEELKEYEHKSFLHPVELHRNGISDWLTDYWIIGTPLEENDKSQTDNKV